MPKLIVSRSIEINASAEAAFQAINDFNAWSKWSPWLILEPGISNTVSEDAKYNEWTGKRSGAGNMRIIEEQPFSKIKIDLRFLKPWKSQAEINFSVEECAAGVKVTWHMQNKLPFFMFFFKKMMETYVGMDFERGLRLLKDFVEDGEVHSSLNFIGIESFDGIKYIGIKTNCTKSSMGKKMSSDIPKLMEIAESNGLTVTGNVFTQYHKWDMVRDNIVYTCGVPVNEFPGQIPSEVVTGEIPRCNVNTVEHKGPYHHLGNAWSASYSMMRNKEFASSKKINAFETYHNNPGDVKETELITQIHFPTK